MVVSALRSSVGLGTLIAAMLLPSVGTAQEAQGPRYTYLGAGYEWTDTKCAIEPEDERIEAYTVEGSIGIFSFLHLLGEYSDGDSDFTYDSDSSAAPNPEISKERDFSCYRLGLGGSYGLNDSVDIVGRLYYVDAEIDDGLTSDTLDDDGYEVEGLVRIMASEKTEVHVGFSYIELDDNDDSDVRIGLIHNITPMVALSVGGIIFDDDTGFNAGVRVYLGDHLF
jgi:hypothetical protein